MCGGHAPIDLTVGIVRAVLQAETESFKERLRRVDARRLTSVISWYYEVIDKQGPLGQLRFCTSYWLGRIERCDQELCSALVQLAALPSVREFLGREASKLRNWLASFPDDYCFGIDRYRREILHPDILEYINCARPAS